MKNQRLGRGFSVAITIHRLNIYFIHYIRQRNFAKRFPNPIPLSQCTQRLCGIVVKTDKMAASKSYFFPIRGEVDSPTRGNLPNWLCMNVHIQSTKIIAVDQTVKSLLLIMTYLITVQINASRNHLYILISFGKKSEPGIKASGIGIG